MQKWKLVRSPRLQQIKEATSAISFWALRRHKNQGWLFCSQVTPGRHRTNEMLRRGCQHLTEGNKEKLENVCKRQERCEISGQFICRMWCSRTGEGRRGGTNPQSITSIDWMNLIFLIGVFPTSTSPSSSSSSSYHVQYCKRINRRRYDRVSSWG